VVLADAGTGQILNTVHVNQKVRKLLAVGKRLVLHVFLVARNSDIISSTSVPDFIKSTSFFVIGLL
jgi:hypothetical protein